MKIKSLMCLCAVLLMVSFASAATLSLQVDAADVSATGYAAGSTITINVVGSGYVAPAQGLGQLTINEVLGAGAAANPALHADLLNNFPDAGTLVNDGTTLISAINGAVAMGNMVGVPNGEVAYTFELTLPTELGAYEYSLSGVTVGSCFGAPVATTLESLSLEVVPEPMTVALLGLGGLFIRRRK